MFEALAEPRIDGVAPNFGLSSLILELRQHVVVAGFVDLPAQRSPLANVAFHHRRAVVVRIVDGLDHRLAGMQLVCVWDVMEEEQQVVGTSRQRFEHCGDGGAVLADVAGSGGNGAVHAHALLIGAVPLSPAVTLGRFHVHSVVVAGDIGERLQA